MATSEKVDSSLKSLTSAPLLEEAGDSPSPSSIPECAICLQTCVHPVQLPCCHVFCFLCVKGASWLSKRCALCRQEVPEDFLERPVLLSPEELKAAAAGVSRGVGGSTHKDYAWYYEGRNGWWQYDERASRELEDAYAKGKKSTEMLIAGFLYVADLENKVQYRQNEHGRRRKIKRDVVDIPKKGVAGLRLDPEPVSSTPATAERVHLADGSDTTGQSLPPAFRFMTSVPPVRPPTLLGRPVNSLQSHTTSTLEETFSQLLISSPGEDVEGDSGSSSESEEEQDRPRRRAQSPQQRRPRQRPLTQNQPSRMPPRAGPPSAALTVRSRSPDGQCTITEV